VPLGGAVGSKRSTVLDSAPQVPNHRQYVPQPPALPTKHHLSTTTGRPRRCARLSDVGDSAALHRRPPRKHFKQFPSLSNLDTTLGTLLAVF